MGRRNTILNFQQIRALVMAAEPVGVTEIVLSSQAYLQLNELCIQREYLLAGDTNTHTLTPEKIIVYGMMFTCKEKVKQKQWTCPECKQECNGSIHKTKTGERCDMVLGRRGWRQLGVYDG